MIDFLELFFFFSKSRLYIDMESIYLAHITLCLSPRLLIRKQPCRFLFLYSMLK